MESIEDIMHQLRKKRVQLSQEIRRLIKSPLLLFTLIFISSELNAVQITIHKQDATVWAQEQIITGDIDTLISNQGVLHLNQNLIPFEFVISDGSFSVPVLLEEDLNFILVEVDSLGTEVFSDTLFL